MPRMLLTAGVPGEQSAHVRPVDKRDTKQTHKQLPRGGLHGEKKRTGLWEIIAGESTLWLRKEKMGRGPPGRGGQAGPVEGEWSCRRDQQSCQNPGGCQRDLQNYLHRIQ